MNASRSDYTSRGRARRAGVHRWSPEFTGDRGRLFNRVLRHLATQARPLTPTDVDAMADDLALTAGDAAAFLADRTEHDTDANIVGFGVTLNPTPHRYTLGSTQVFTWCAADTLIFPIVLSANAIIESASPVSGTTIRLTAGPDGVDSVDPQTATISLPIVGPGQIDTGNVEAIWTTFCHRSYFFPTAAEGEQWAANRDNIENVSLTDGFAYARQWAAILGADRE